MKHTAWVLLALAVVVAPAGARGQDAAQLFRTAITLETVDGDCKGAIELYKKVANGTDRSLAAQALLRMGGCHQANGNAEAKTVYERLLKDFGDQPVVVAAARAKLAVLIGSAGFPPIGPFATRPPDTRLTFDSILAPDGSATVEIANGRLVERDLTTNRERVVLGVGDTSQFPRGSDAQFRQINQPLWSRSSREVCFVVDSWGPSAVQRELRVFVRATGELRAIPSSATSGGAGLTPLAWTTKGDIVYRRTVVDGPDASEYFLVSSSGGESRRILQSLSVAGGDQFGDLLPDGSAAIVVKGERLSRIDLATGEERPITLGIGVAVPRVSPDGRLVAFLSKQSSRWALYVAPLDRLPIRNPVPVANLEADVNIQNFRRPFWTTGGQLMFNYETGGHNVYRIDIDPQTARPLGPPERLSQALPGLIAWVSPDSKHIAYSARGGGVGVITGGGVAVMAADGSEARRLTPQGDFPVQGWRSPTEILYTDRGREPDGNFTIRSIDLTTGVAAPLPFLPRLMSPRLQFVVPTQEVVHLSRGNLMARSQVDGRERILGAFRLNGWRLSRDGTWLGTRLDDGTTSLFRIDANGTVTPIGTLDGANKGLPRAWSPKGTHLVIEPDSGGLRIVEVATMQSWPLMIRPAGVERDTTWDWWGDADWAPDGSFIVASMNARRRIRLAFEGVTYDAVVKLAGAK